MEKLYFTNAQKNAMNRYKGPEPLEETDSEITIALLACFFVCFF
jgi:hypothetical protein